MAISKACKPGNFESHNAIKLSFTIIQGCRLNFVDCESFLESNSPYILALCETNLDDSIDSGNFSVRSYFPLILKDSSSHTLTCSLCEGMTCFSIGLISRKLQILTLIFDWLYFTQCLAFSSIDHLLCLCVCFLTLFHLT